MRRFIVGTDTDVGKTYYGRLLMKRGKHVIKPIETGFLSFEDINESDSYHYANGQGKEISEVNCYFFSEPVSPHYASEIDSVIIDIDKVKSFIHQYQDVFIELAGGLMVPIKDQYTQLDLIKDTQNACVELVIGNKLGCLNHGLMTMRILENEKIHVSKIVINNMGKDPTICMINNIETLKKLFQHKMIVEII